MFAGVFDFDLIHKGKENNNTLLVIGGIQGDEPGGFMAASLLATHYDILQGSVWIVPNLNFKAIVKRSRGVYGDLNRKFAELSHDDPEYELVQKVKNYIMHPSVTTVLNLHDGGGFYRDTFIDNLYNPRRWGQTAIIDQEILDHCNNENLKAISEGVIEKINQNLLKKEHLYSIKNTNTRLGDKEMEKSLTYFAINQCKKAFGNEASKNLGGVHERVYYHLLALEGYMDAMGIKYKRRIGRTPEDIKKTIDSDVSIELYDKQITLPLGGAREVLGYIPITRDGNITFKPSSPVMTILKDGEYYKVHYGNRVLTKIFPSFREYLNEYAYVTLQADGKNIKIPFGYIVDVKNDFLIPEQNGYRVNVIGFPSKRMENEAGKKIAKKGLQKQFSIDKKGNLYRAEFYKNEKFAGMVLLRFNGQKTNIASNLFNDFEVYKKSSTLN